MGSRLSLDKLPSLEGYSSRAYLIDRSLKLDTNPLCILSSNF